MVCLKEFRGVYLVSWFPGVVTFRVSFPFEKVLELSGSSVMSVAPYLLHFVFFFASHEVRWWSREVWSMCCGLVVW
jgi:hypothetical protein